MDLKDRRIVGVLLALMYFLSISAVSLLVAFGHAQTILRTVPQEMVLGSPALEDVTDTEFIIAVVVEDVSSLLGIDIQFGWNTTYLEYINHTVTIPVENYPSPIPPSPYPGILHEPVWRSTDRVNEAGLYWVIYLVRPPFPPFNGSGTVFIMRFRVEHQPHIDELPADADHVNLTLRFTSTDLCSAQSIPHVVKDGIVKLYAQPSSPDINNDGTVDIYDIVIAANAYGSRVGDPDWNLGVDLAPEWGKIDIYDLVTCAYHYGEEA